MLTVDDLYDLSKKKKNVIVNLQYYYRTLSITYLEYLMPFLGIYMKF